MANSTFPVIDKVIRIWAMPEFVHLDCDTLISSCGAHKHSFALKPLSILNTGPITTFLLTSLSTYLKWKIKKMFKEVNETVKKNFFPTHMCAYWCDQLNGCVNKLTRRKLFYKNPFVGILVCTTRVICLTFVLWRLASFFPDFKKFLHAPIWALLILDIHPFSGSESS